MSQKVEQAWFTTEYLRKYKIRSECMKRVYKKYNTIFLAIREMKFFFITKSNDLTLKKKRFLMFCSFVKNILSLSSINENGI